MTLRRPKILLALGVALSVASAARAGEVPINKGKVAKAGTATCSVTLKSDDDATITTIGNKTVIQCADGAACDKDNAKNGSCTFGINICTGAELTGCTAEPATSIKTAAKAKKAGLVAPTTPQSAVTSTCGAEGSLIVPLKGKNKDKASAFGKGKMIVKAKLGSGKGNIVAFAQCTPGTDCVGDSCPPPPTPTCANRGPGVPKQINFKVPDSGSDLDNGYSGNSHNFPVTSGSTLRYCLAGCDASTTSTCNLTGSTGDAANTLNGPVFGAPLPLLANGVPVCVVNRYADANLTGTYDLATGELAGTVNLHSDVYIQTPLTDVCPRCNGAGLGQQGTCTTGQNQGKACTVDGTSNVVGSAGNQSYNLSTQCPPANNLAHPTLEISLPLTTGTSESAQQSKPCPGQTVDDACGGGSCTVDCSGTKPAKGGINQTCCSNNPAQACFPTAADSPPGKIVRTGIPMVPLPAWPDPTYPKTVDGGKSAAVFCESKTNDPTVDNITGLPGPGALILPYTQEVLAE